MSEQSFQLTPELEGKVLQVIEKGLNGIAKRSVKPSKTVKKSGKASTKSENEKIAEKIGSSAAKTVDSPKKDKTGKIISAEFSALKRAYNKADENRTASKLTSSDYKKVATVATELYLIQLAKEPKPVKKASDKAPESKDSDNGEESES